MAERKRCEMAGWGNSSKSLCYTLRPESLRELKDAVAGESIARGLGRSYGDAAISGKGQVLLMERLNRFIAFDPFRGILRVEGGVTLADILQLIVPKGWFLPVTPGTKYVTVGGAIACDVHGKNHHRAGSLGRYVRELTLLTAAGTMEKISPASGEELFNATLGGMGLTGVIVEAELLLSPIESGYMAVKHSDVSDLDQMVERLLDPAYDDSYSVAWIDALAKGGKMGRGVLMTGHHAALSELPPRCDRALPPLSKKKLSLPCNFPEGAVNSATIALFNECYYRLERRKGSFIAHYDSYFYPLDRFLRWNRLYGKRGFFQYQFLLPLAGVESSLRQIMEKVSASRRGSFLAVLKRLGGEGEGYLSFPGEGLTLALDLPAGDGGLPQFLRQLDKDVERGGGRIYLAKDALSTPETFRGMYPRYSKWLEVKRRVDPEGRFQSDLSRRLEIGEL